MNICWNTVNESWLDYNAGLILSKVNDIGVARR